ncbi:hypothetical protein [Brevibacillus brevis]|uniref:DUF4145 domain-containing protein n=1 Tax=Brevibacillus brevis TaxID=1393 RepID=A0A517ICN0_BREBE|nr:hypothetical protein [Brevibacillus brevis]QDS36628.1 hypothetical protein FPS98_23005 [Brevibacillus brevis]
MAEENHQINLNLFENGLDFFQSGIELTKNNDGNLKYAVLHLASGIELVLKYRLALEHWSLIFKDIREAKRSALETGKFKSVDFDECMTRLANIAGVIVTEKDARHFKELRERRNRFIHFNVDESYFAMKSASLKVMNSLLEFINNHIDESILSRGEIERISDIRSSLLDFKEFVDKRMQMLSGEIAAYKKQTVVTECPGCFQKALILNKDYTDKAVCLFCSHTGEGEDIAREYVDTILNISAYEVATSGGEYPLYECEECRVESLVRTEKAWVCFSCGDEWKLDRIVYCDTCGTPFVEGPHGIGMCSYCIDYRMRD